MIIREKIHDGYTIQPYTTKTYISSDGAEFETENACLSHERSIELEKFKKTFKEIKVTKDYDSIFNFSVGDSWKLIETDEQLKYAKEECGYTQSYDRIRLNDKDSFDNGTSFNYPKLKIGDWYSVRYEDGGDYRGYYYVYTLEYFKEMIYSFLDEIDHGINDIYYPRQQ